MPEHEHQGNGHHGNSNHEQTHSSNEDSPLLEIEPDGESGRSGFHPIHFLSVTWSSSNKASMWVNVLWPFVPVAIVMHYATPSLPLWIFAMSFIAMVPAANMVGFAGQQLARKLPKVSGILIETALGSIVEIVLFVVLIVKHDTNHGSAEEGNYIPVLQAAILGSILTNLLFCLGLCFFVGGIRHKSQKFHPVISEVGTGLLLVAGFGLLIPSAFYSALKGVTKKSAGAPELVLRMLEESKKEHFTDSDLDNDIVQISHITSIMLIIAFAVYIFHYSRSHSNDLHEVLEREEHADLDRSEDLAKPKYTFTESILALAISLTLVTLLAVFLVERIDDVVESGCPDQFLGLILLPFVEKAAEHLTAVDEAWDGQMNFALYHCLGPSIQTALFNAPLVVIVGWILNKPMDLNFEIFMIVLLVLAILVVGNFLRDGESNYLEGALLVIVYAIIAVSTYFYPNPDVATSNGLSFDRYMMEMMANAVKAANGTVVFQVQP